MPQDSIGLRNVSGSQCVVRCNAECGETRALSEQDVVRSASGGGGSDMHLGLAAIQEVFEKDPGLVIVATDGGTNWPETTTFPTIAVFTSDGVDTSPDWMPSVSVQGVPA